MKTRLLIITVGVIISSSIIFAILFEPPFEKKHYNIKISGLKDAYLIGESFAFGYVISGYGNPCGDIEIHIPDEKGDSKIMRTLSDCNTRNDMQHFEYRGTFGSGNTVFEHPGIKYPRIYNVNVTYERGIMEPTMGGKSFHVVEKICNDSDPKNKAQCFADAFDSCTSSFAEFAFPTGEGDGILVTSIVESWNDCNLRVYTDHTQDRYKGDSSGTRSICDGMMINDEFISFENCNNEEIPPLRFDQQYYLYKERCEIFGGWWNFEYNTCFDFSDEYDCETMGGKLEGRAYTGEQPDYSKKSDSFVCEFRK